MKASLRVASGILIALGAAVFLKLLVGGNVVALLSPRGLIASQEFVVIAKTVLLMLAAAVPTIVVCFLFACRYRADNPKAKYEPDREAGPWTQLAMWAAPTSLIAVLWIVVWFSAHALDPYNPIASSTPPMVIQVVA
ncbi:MAG TPA: ubiquinol oxidase subunit II, partial [Patescibacteria group bacterium]|nr:ubiquinol oxidase subunit II [Patescibacteria group bacterium]